MENKKASENVEHQDHPIVEQMTEIRNRNANLLDQDISKFSEASAVGDWNTALELANWIYERTVVVSVLDQLIEPEKYR